MGLEKNTKAVRVGRDLHISCISSLSFQHICFNYPRAEAPGWHLPPGTGEGRYRWSPAAAPALAREALRAAFSRRPSRALAAVKHLAPEPNQPGGFITETCFVTPSPKYFLLNLAAPNTHPLRLAGERAYTTGLETPLQTAGSAGGSSNSKRCPAHWQVVEDTRFQPLGTT